MENNSPAKAGLVGGKLLDLDKRGRKTQNEKKKRKEKTEAEPEQKQSKNPEKEIIHSEKKREEEPTQKTKEENQKRKKTEKKPEQKNRVRTRAKTDEKPEKEIIHREKERKRNQHSKIIVPAIAFISADTPAQKKTPKTNSQQADIIFLVLKAAEKKKKGKHRQVSTEGRQREAVGENHHQRCKHLRSPEAGTPVSSFTFASSFQIELLQEHCAKVINYLHTVFMHA